MRREKQRGEGKRKHGREGRGKGRRERGIFVSSKFSAL
jgi:hypothetical protein